MTTTSAAAISGMNTLNNAAASGKDSASSQTQLFDDMEAFLYLLTQQLKYQDPLDPMDTSEYTNQLVQYAQVEQAIQSNSYLETIVSQNVNAVATQAISYMDKTVQALSNVLPLQDGNAKFSYILPADASSVVVALKDPSGDVIKTFTNLDLSAGRHEVEWDGKDTSGNQIEDGAYQLIVTAVDENGASLQVQNTVYGKVTGVAYDGEMVAIGMGDVAVDMNSILAIHTSDTLKPSTSPETEGGTEGEGSGEGSGESGGESGGTDSESDKTETV